MEENKDAKQIISQLLENYHTSVSMIAHEIRNPLTLVSSSLQIMEIQHPEVKEFHNWNQTMEDVQFMCSSTLHHSVFQIEKLLKNIAVSFAISLDAADSDIRFSSKIQSNMGDFTGDKIKLEEVILNLLQNAREAVSSEGSIILIGERSGDQIIIQCRDNGCGIPKDALDKIFDPFVTYKENGTGLGLSSARRITEAHGGTITVKSSPGEETVFTVTLPI